MSIQPSLSLGASLSASVVSLAISMPLGVAQETEVQLHPQARFHGGGVDFRPLGAAEPIRVRLARFGWEDEQVGVTAPLRTESSGERVTHAWTPGLDEWFFREGSALEHGFSVLAPPSRVGRSAEESAGCDGAWIALDVDIDGPYSVVIDAATARHASFLDATGVPAASYTDLVVIDAHGLELPARLDTTATGLRIAFDARGATYPIIVDPLFQDVYIKAPNAESLDSFGGAVAVFGDRIAIGATGEDGGSTGIDGNLFDNSAPGSGAVYVYRFVAGAWTLEAYVKPSNTDAGDLFGAAIDLGQDVLVVGAPGESSGSTAINSGSDRNDAPEAGAVYVFRFSPTTSSWSETAYIKASNTDAGDAFGFSVAYSRLSPTGGSWLLVGAQDEDSALPGVGADNSSFNAGAAYLYTEVTSNNWTERAYLKPGQTSPDDLFGTAVALQAPGELGGTGFAIVGSPNEDSGATGVNGDETDNGSPNAGAVYVFPFTSQSVAPYDYLKGLNTGAGDNFGAAVSMFESRIAVGAPLEDSSIGGVNPPGSNDTLANAGAAYTFFPGFSGWIQDAYVKASNPGAFDRFGSTLELAFGSLIVGAAREASTSSGINGDQSSNGAAGSGAAYLYGPAVLTPWVQTAFIKASNSEANDVFGSSVAISDRWVVVGAPREDSSGVGVGASQFSNGAISSGAGYVFRLGDGAFLNYCSLSPNSTGAAGVVTGTGSGLISENNVVLTASSLPAFSFGFFIVGPERDFVMQPAGSAGDLCVGGSIGRYVGPGQIQNSGAQGVISLAINALAIPTPLGPITAQPGEEFHFQAWYRDSIAGVPGSNFTRATTVLFR